MAYGVKTYSHTVGSTMRVDVGSPYDLTTTDLPVSDYTLKNVKISFPIKMEEAFGEGYFEVQAIVGRIVSGTFHGVMYFNNPPVIDYTSADAGRTIQYVIDENFTDQVNINNLNAIALNPEYSDSGDIQPTLVTGAKIKVEITHTGTSACIPPETVTAPTYIHYHGGIHVTWSAGTAGNKSPVTGYAVYRSATANGTYTKVGETDKNTRFFDDYDYAIGDVKYYKIKTLTDDHNYDSALSGRSGGTTALQRTTAPTIRTGSAGGVYNPRPRILLTLGTDALQEALTVTAENYQGRAQPMAATKMVLQRMTDMEAGQESVTVTNTDTSGVSYSATAAVKVLSVTWTDDPIVAGETRVKAAHIMELRACLDNICDYYGLSHTDWGGDLTAGVSSAGNWPAHMAAIQATARRIAQFINSWDAVTQEFGVTLPFFETVNRANARAVNQMRQIITML